MLGLGCRPNAGPQERRRALASRFELGLAGVDAGDGWLIFALPPAEIAVHPSDRNDVHEVYLLTDDVDVLVQRFVDRGVACTEPKDLGWGVMTRITLPGGGQLGIYEPRHSSPLSETSQT